MVLNNVLDLTIQEVKDTSYDLVIFASGYETRCLSLSQALVPSLARDVVVFGFSEHRSDVGRQIHGSHFRVRWCREEILSSADDDSVIFDTLRVWLASNDDRNLRILIDYSSMSRLWYAAVLMFFRHSRCRNSVRIDFIYSIGSRADAAASTTIQDVLTIPGCEGRQIAGAQSVAIFGLGGTDVAPLLCVLDDIEPKVSHCFCASPGSEPAHDERAQSVFKEVITEHSKPLLRFPLRSVEQTYARLCQVVSPYLGEFNTVIVPMGPKPHVLSSILLSIQFDDVTCLRVSRCREMPEPVDATGEFVCTRVFFRPEYSFLI